MKQTESQKPPITMGLADHAIEEDQAAELLRQGKLQEAEKIYRMLIDTGSKNCIVFGNLAAICGTEGRFDELIELLKKALQLKPNYTEAHNNLGLAFKMQGNLDAAIASFNTALQLNPNYAEAHNNLGIALKEQGNLDAAIASFNTALQLKPNYTEAHNNLGNALHKQGNLDAAIASFNTALQLNPNYTEAHNNLGVTLKEQGNLDAAIASFNTALQLKPNYTEAHNNLGIALHEQGNLDAAIASYKTALQLNPNFPSAHWNLSLTMLLGGNYKKGWEEYEWRSKNKKISSTPHAQPKCSLWDGLRPSPNRQVLLVSEQGLGDTLQFMRFAIVLREQGASISFCAQPKLHSLIKASGINSSPLTPEEANKVSEGQWIPLLSVPRHLGVSSQNPVITEPYIKTTNELSRKWNDILSNEQRPIIGINWQGNPKIEKEGLKGRSLALETFAPIAVNHHISLLSLQKGFGSEQLETCSFKDRFVTCQDQINDTWDFLETAAIIANCDLIITSDTSVAHLAGGMGKTTWLLLHKVPDWRWGLEAETTFWYPTMRLFRQKTSGNWDEVLKKITEALKKHF